MMNIIEDENFKIKFIERIKIPLNFLYKIQVICKNNNILYSKSILCNSGINLVLLNIFTLNSKELFKTIPMKVNETIDLYIAFQKINTSTNQPKISYKNESTKVIL